MPVDHYENFPVASLLVPPALRPAVETIYRFARSADDLADEGNASPEARLSALESYRDELLRLAAGQKPATALFVELGEVIRRHALPIQPFLALLGAFKQDVVKTRYADFDELLNYCQRSANPVGHIMLHLFGCADPLSLRQSDAICTALQLTNFWQDVAIDWQKGRIYLPQADLAHFAVNEGEFNAPHRSPRWRELMGFQIDRTEALMREGAPLVKRLPGRFGWEIRATVQGGLRILARLREVQGDVFNHRPQLGARDWLVIAARCFRM